ncbi:hypothetical protein BH23ACT11_BH23ACT11_09260 [soil metagenome]
MIDRQRLRTFLLGGAVGALAGVLLAPRSGRELRSNVANRAGEARERSRETFYEKQESLQEKLAERRTSTNARREGRNEAPIEAGSPASLPENFTERPRLREVSEDTYDEEPSDTRPDDLRRKVQETRERLRKSLERTEQSGVEDDPDE